MLERWSGSPAPSLPGGPQEQPPTRSRLTWPLTALLMIIGVIGLATWLARTPVSQPIALATLAPGERVPREVKVHVTGEVAQPGVYAATDADRVIDVLDRAGVLEGADLARVNLAQRLRDQQQIVVPRAGAPMVADKLVGAAASPSARRPTATALAPGTRLNLNHASAADLEALPGIGEVTARKIIDRREQKGPFASADELRLERIVTASTWERIKELIEAP